MLDSWDLDWMQDAVEDYLLPDLCTIQQPVRTNTGTGRSVTYNPTATNGPCRVDPAGNSPEEKLIGTQNTGTSVWSITLRHSVVLQNDYRIVVTGGATYEVKGVAHHQSWTTCKVATCILVGGDD
jgi:hypothetical protein